MVGQRSKKRVAMNPTKPKGNYALRNVFSFYKLRQEVLVPFLLRDMLENRRKELLSSGGMSRSNRKSAAGSAQPNKKSSQQSSNEKSGQDKTKRITAIAEEEDESEAEEDSVSHDEDWSGWDVDD